MPVLNDINHMECPQCKSMDTILWGDFKVEHGVTVRKCCCGINYEVHWKYFPTKVKIQGGSNHG